LQQHRWRQRTTADERRTWDYDWLLTSGETAAELRLFGLGPLFQSLYQALRRRLPGRRLHLARTGPFPPFAPPPRPPTLSVAALCGGGGAARSAGLVNLGAPGACLPRFAAGAPPAAAPPRRGGAGLPNRAVPGHLFGVPGAAPARGPPAPPRGRPANLADR